MKLRKDERQWLIYQEEAVVPAIRALEVLALLVAGPVLARHPLIEMRALGNMMLRLGTVREEWMLGLTSKPVSDEEVAAGRHIATILGEMSGVTNADDARDELHAAVFWLDSFLRQSGIKGDGWTKDLARGTG